MAVLDCVLLRVKAGRKTLVGIPARFLSMSVENRDFEVE
jgi:hypothetical protein